MSRTLVITHASCFDGHTAAWLYSRFVDGSAEFIAARYGDPIPELELSDFRDVVIADFSYPREQMLKIAARARKLTVLDHHKTAEQALVGFAGEAREKTGNESINVVFDMERSGCGILCDHFGVERTELVRQVEARDLWRVAQFDEAYMANVYAAPMTFEAWDDLNSLPKQTLMMRGCGILAYIHQYGTKALAEARKVKIGPLYVNDTPIAKKKIHESEAWAVNMPYMNCSDYLSRLMAEKGTDFVMGYFCRGDGRWQFSLRSRNGFDCSEIAKIFGGGGHKEASGFDVASLEEVFVS